MSRDAMSVGGRLALDFGRPAHHCWKAIRGARQVHGVGGLGLLSLSTSLALDLLLGDGFPLALHGVNERPDALGRAGLLWCVTYFYSS